MEKIQEFIAVLEAEHKKVEEVIRKDRFASSELRGEMHGESVGIRWCISKAKKMLVPPLTKQQQELAAVIAEIDGVE